MERRTLADRHFLIERTHGAKGTVLFLAGTGSTAEWAVEETRLTELVEAGYDLVVPEATRPRPDEPAKFISNPPRWNDCSPPPTPELATNVDDVAFLDTLLDELQSKRVFLVGFSNGAGMAFRYASQRAERLTAIAPIAGLWWPTDARPARPLPTFYLLGLADPLIPYRGGEVRLPWGNRIVKRPSAIATIAAWSNAIGCQPQSTIIEQADRVRLEQFAGPVEMRATFLEGMGHHWPGGRGQLNPRLAGPNVGTFNLNRALIEFFDKINAAES